MVVVVAMLGQTLFRIGLVSIALSGWLITLPRAGTSGRPRAGPCIGRRAGVRVWRCVGLIAMLIAVAPAVLAAELAAALPAVQEPDLDLPLSAADQRHLLARTGFGVAPSEFAQLQGLTRQQGIDRIIDGLRDAPATPMPAFTQRALPHYHTLGDVTPEARRVFEQDRDMEMATLRLWWSAEMLSTGSPQTERLVLFWHDLFATAYEGTERQSLAMARQNERFRTHLQGSWAAMLKAMLRDAALLDYLDNDQNRRDGPNENLARELLELFTLGEGHYVEATVHEAARALTGYNTSDVKHLAFHLQSWDQDEGNKLLFGERGTFDGDDLIDLVLAQPEAAEFLAAKFWHAFISDAPPVAAELAALSEPFRASGHDLAVLYRAVLESEAFWSARHRAGLVKSPVDLLVGTARTLEYPKQHWQSLPAMQAALGMSLFSPPSVAGWPEGDAFVTPSMLINRYAAVEQLLSGPSTDSKARLQSMSEVGGLGEMGSMDHTGGMSEPDGMSETGGMSEAGVMRSTVKATEQSAQILVRMASESYQGPVQFELALEHQGKRVWHSAPVSAPQGHDSERLGRAPDLSALAWQQVAVSVPASALKKADELSVQFINDAAGDSGDRNLYIDGVQIDERWLPASDGQQTSECPPELSSDAGNLYCDGELRLSLQGKSTGSKEPEPWTAAGAWLLWADVDETDEISATIALDWLHTPVRDVEILQMRIVALPDGALELHLDSFGCRPDCLSTWPDCSWVDERFPETRAVSWPLDSDAEAYCPIEQLDEVDRTLVRALIANAPRLLQSLVDTPRGQEHLDALQALLMRLESLPLRQGAKQIRIDASLTPSPEPRQSLPAPERLVDDLIEWQTAMVGLQDEIPDPLMLLWPGIESEASQPVPATVLQARLKTITQHPAFQLK